MFFNKKSKPISEKSAPVAPTGKLESQVVNQLSGEIASPNDGFVDYERKQIVLAESEARYRRLFETAKDGILILDGDTGRITDANPFLQDMLGYSKNELIGKALWEIGPVKNIAASQVAMRQLQNQEYIRYEDIPLETKGGERRQVEFVSNVYLVNGWRVIQCNIRDITERKHAESLAQAANAELLALVGELQWRDQAMQLLNHLNEVLQSCVTAAEAYKVITLTVGELFPGQNGYLAVLDPKNQQFVEVAHWGQKTIMESTFLLDDCWALRRGQLHEVIDPQAGLVCTHFTQIPQAGYLCLPLTVLGETLGVLCLIEGSTQNGKQHLSQRQLAVTLGETIKLSLSNLKLRDELRRQAIHDPLTGLFNRRYLDETLPRELYVAQRRNVPLCIVMLDIDGFKQINDSFGHGIGDAFLRDFGSILRERLRKSDISCRYGGDEFVLVLPDSSIADTQERVEQIRKFLKELKIHYGEKVLEAVTLSAGIVQTSEHDINTSELLRMADEAMYAAKQAGRDRIIIHEI